MPSILQLFLYILGILDIRNEKKKEQWIRKKNPERDYIEKRVFTRAFFGWPARPRYVSDRVLMVTRIPDAK